MDWKLTLALLLAACDSSSPRGDSGADAGTDAKATMDAAAMTGCTDDTDCMGSTPFCGTDGECVECKAHSHCDDPNEAKCSATGACEPCDDSALDAKAQCAGIVGGLQTCSAGQCVECTVATEADDCGTKACNPATLECGDVDRGSVGRCQKCESDSECISDGNATHRCVPMKYNGVDHGTYCLPDRATVSGMTCPQQYADAPIKTSVGGIQANYCSPREALATCEAVLDFTSQCNNDSECGSPKGEGLCRDDTGTSACSYVCQGDRDCDVGSKCNQSATPKYCCTGTGSGGCANL